LNPPMVDRQLPVIRSEGSREVMVQLWRKSRTARRYIVF
jgi:hypothetical protein